MVTFKRLTESDIICAPFLMDLLLEDVENNFKDVAVQETGACSVTGNPAAIVRTKSWLHKYGTDLFAVDLLTGDIYAIKDGIWEKVPEMAKIDKKNNIVLLCLLHQ